MKTSKMVRYLNQWDLWALETLRPLVTPELLYILYVYVTMPCIHQANNQMVLHSLQWPLDHFSQMANVFSTAGVSACQNSLTPAFSCSTFFSFIFVLRYCFSNLQMFSMGLRSGLDAGVGHQFMFVCLKYAWAHRLVGFGSLSSMSSRIVFLNESHHCSI